MTTKVSVLQPILLTPGCQPSTDRTNLSTTLSTFSDKIRWFQGFPQKIGGWVSQAFNYGAIIQGVCRRVMSAYLGNETTLVTLIGTNSNLYALAGSTLTNITPLNTSTIASANSLATDFRALGSNPATFTSGSSMLVISDPDAAQYQNGDDVTLAGFSGTIHGIASSVINGQQVIRSIDLINSTYTVNVAGTATSSGTGGGAGVTVGSGLVTVSATAQGQTNGQRTKIASAAAFGGITIGEINAEFIVRGAQTNSFQVMTAGTATSAVTAAGGAGTTYQTQIAPGTVDENASQGYGAGLYGIGLYGSALQSTNGRTLPRIWCIDRFEADFVLSPGNQLGIYTWDGNTSIAPTLLANAPTAVNYAFSSHDIIVTFGYQGVANQIFASDQANPTNWTASSSNQVFQDTITGAGPLVSHLSCNNVDLLFTDSRVYTFTYVGLAGGTGLVWDIALLDSSIGIIGQNAGCVVNGVAYWMGLKNFYMWAGGNVEIVPSATQTVPTIMNYVFENLTAAQKSKIFCWNNEQYNEIWWHYPSANSDEPDRVARLNVNDLNWVPDTFDRTAAEVPDILTPNPLLVSSESVLYQHENGVDADGAPMPFILIGNLRYGANTMTPNLRLGGKSTMMIEAVIPDSIQTGNVTLSITAKQYPQSPITTFDGDFTITPTTEIMPVQIGGRFWQYGLSGNDLGQQWIGGQWMEQIQIGPMQ